MQPADDTKNAGLYPHGCESALVLSLLRLPRGRVVHSRSAGLDFRLLFGQNVSVAEDSPAPVD